MKVVVNGIPSIIPLPSVNWQNYPAPFILVYLESVSGEQYKGIQWLTEFLYSERLNLINP